MGKWESVKAQGDGNGEEGEVGRSMQGKGE